MVGSLLQDFSKELELASRYSLHEPPLQELMESMQTPWLDVANQLRSVCGFAGLHAIGSRLSTSQAFGDDATEILRLDLGDWREKITWPARIDIDPVVRTSLYRGQGFNPDLTTFPHTAFEEIVTEAGLKVPRVPKAEGYDLDGEFDGIGSEAAFQRTNDAHDSLQRFESQLRRFIDKRMERTFGPSWIKQRIPGEMRSNWLNKQKQDPDLQCWPLIAYADFTDYVIIITRNDNWRDLFEAVFVNKSSVQESFRRLYPIRLATMHSRVTSQHVVY